MLGTQATARGPQRRANMWRRAQTARKIFCCEMLSRLDLGCCTTQYAIGPSCAGTSHAASRCGPGFERYPADYDREQLSSVSLSQEPGRSQFFASGLSFPLQGTGVVVSRPMELWTVELPDLNNPPQPLRVCTRFARPTWDSVFRLFACTVRTDLTKSRRKWS
jgi:hypothetical protein